MCINIDVVQALAEKNAAIAESERCQRKLGLANRLIAALASEGDRWALTVQQLRKDYKVTPCTCLPWVFVNAQHSTNCVFALVGTGVARHTAIGPCHTVWVFLCASPTSILVEVPWQTCLPFLVERASNSKTDCKIQPC